jgi:hypothetical protein
MLQKHYLRWKQGKPKGPGLDVMADALGFAAVVKRRAEKAFSQISAA